MYDGASEKHYGQTGSNKKVETQYKSGGRKGSGCCVKTQYPMGGGGNKTVHTNYHQKG